MFRKDEARRTKEDEARKTKPGGELFWTEKKRCDALSGATSALAWMRHVVRCPQGAQRRTE